MTVVPHSYQLADLFEAVARRETANPLTALS
jgi:hypothetical protein